MKVVKNTTDMYEEINSETNPTKRNMLLQKYGLIEPKLTIDEQMKIRTEQYPFLR